MASGCTLGSAGAEASIRRFVDAWSNGSLILGATITGEDAPRLIDALQGLPESGVVRTAVDRLDERGGRWHAVVAARFADGARITLPIAARVEGGRVVAEPTAITTRLDRWERLRIDRFGSPKRGAILTNNRRRIASGSSAHRRISRSSLSEAVALIDDELDHRLAGNRGVRVTAGHRGPILAVENAVDGDDVVTSLDDSLQRVAEQAFDDSSGALVAVDPRTGGIRAIVSRGSDDATGSFPASTAYSPGSTFKVVTAAAALEHGVLSAGDAVPCPALITVGERQITNVSSADHGRIALEEAFAISCNTAFARVGIAVGTTRLLGTAKDLGFRVGETAGHAVISVPRSRAELATWSFGADGSRASPLHMAGIGATIANRGVSVVPGWTDEGNIGTRALSSTAASALVAMMERVVERGTGKNAAVSGMKVAGKTGTADPEEDRGRSDAWFIGLAPSSETKLVAVVFLPGAGLGGERAAGLAAKFFSASALH